MTDALLFAAQLKSHEPCRGNDAIVVICGEDIQPRLDRAFKAFKAGVAPLILLSGGKDEAPRWMGAARARTELLEAGVAPDRILIENASQNTHEQAHHVIAYAVRQEWKQILLVASSYHETRAFLTFVQALKDAGQDTTIRLISAAAPAAWLDPIDGITTSRVDLFGTEVHKIAAYQQIGHAASYADGIAYLQQWEPIAFGEAA